MLMKITNQAPHLECFWEVDLHEILTPALDEDEWSASRSGRFTAGERVPFPLVKWLEEL
jgi:hypothetical protein